MTANRQRIGFDDDKVVSNQRQDRPDRYSAKQGRQDRIRIVSPLTRCFGASIKNKVNADKSFFMYSCADPEDAYAAVCEGDEAAIKRCEKQCPLFAKSYPVAERFACLIYLISSTDSRGKVREEGKIFPWVFAGDKYVQLRNVQKNLPINPKTKKPVPLQAIEILIDCTDDKFQKMQFFAVTDPASLTMSYKDCLAACADEFDPPGDANGTCQLIEDVIAPESKQNMLRSLERAENGGDDEEPDEFASGGKQGQGQQRQTRKPAAAKPDAGSAGDTNEDDSGEFDLGDEGAPGEEEAETPPPAQTRRGPGKPPVASGKKQTTKPEAQGGLGFEDDIPF